MKHRTIPKHALTFSAPVLIEEGLSGDPSGDRKFSAVAYSGGVIEDHWLSPCAFDIATMVAETPLPALLNHDTEKTVGVSDSVVKAETVTVDGTLFASIDEDAAAIAMKADRGMPWGISFGLGNGTKLIEYPAGVKTIVNGREFEGPLNVLVNARVREVSFCPVAADGRTSARVFSADENTTIEVETMPNPNTDDLASQVEALKAQFAATQERISEAEARATAAEARAVAAEEALSAERTAARERDVKELFSMQGREFSAEAAKPYMGLTSEQFAAIVGDFKAVREASSKLPGELFRHVAGSPPEAHVTFDSINAEISKQFVGG